LDGKAHGDEALRLPAGNSKQVESIDENEHYCL
jgi:hypothetical protein